MHMMMRHISIATPLQLLLFQRVLSFHGNYYYLLLYYFIIILIFKNIELIFLFNFFYKKTWFGFP
jgi:hypothetical protein